MQIWQIDSDLDGCCLAVIQELWVFATISTDSTQNWLRRWINCVTRNQDGVVDWAGMGSYFFCDCGFDRLSGRFVLPPVFIQ